jgi:hypothetical protein
MLRTLSQRSRVSGTSLVDVMFAISLVSFASASLFLLYSSALQLMQLQADTQAATLCLQERAEQMRGLNQAQLEDAPSLQGVLATLPSSAQALPGLTEDITVSAYPAVAGATLHVRRTPPGAAVTVTQPSGSSLAAATVVRVDLRTTWTGRGRTHIRENSLLVAPGGNSP